MAEPYKHIYKVDLNQQLVRRDVGLLATFDSKANRFGAELYRDGASVSASGYTVNGYFIRPNEETVPIPGTVQGNLVYVDLLPGCYVYDGAFEFALKIKQGDVEQTVLLCYGTVERSRTDATASGGDVLVTVTNAEMLGGKPPEYYLPAVQLLDNSDFSIAQAGRPVWDAEKGEWISGLHGSVPYIADRWYIGGTGAIVSYDETSGLTVGKGAGETYIEQCTTINISKNAGKSYTFAVYADGVINVLHVTLPGSASKDFSKGNMLLHAYSDGLLRVRVRVDEQMTILRAILLPGTYTAETLPPFVPPDPTLELAKCQYYAYIVGRDDYHTHVGTATASTNNIVNIFIPLPNMRNDAAPTVTLEGSMGISSFSGSYALSRVWLDTWNQRGVMIRGEVVNGNFNAPESFDVYVGAGSRLMFTKDL